MKKVIFFGTVVLFLFSLFRTQATANTYIENNSNFLLDQILDLTKKGDYVHASNLLDQYSASYWEKNTPIKNYTPKDLETIDVTMANAKQSLKNDGADQQEKIGDILGIRLLVDAETTTVQPMWKELKKSVMTPLDNMIASYKRGDLEEYQIQLNQFLNQFEIIYPALLVDIPYEEIKKVNSLISFLDDFRINTKEIPAFSQKLDSTKDEMILIFSQNANTILTPTFWTLFTTGGIIIGTLCYVGIRRYIGEKKISKKRRDIGD
jgi:sporulation protein YpjB